MTIIIHLPFSILVLLLLLLPPNPPPFKMIIKETPTTNL